MIHFQGLHFLAVSYLVPRSVTLTVLPVGCRHEVTGLRPNRRDGTGNEWHEERGSDEDSDRETNRKDPRLFWSLLFPLVSRGSSLISSPLPFPSDRGVSFPYGPLRGDTTRRERKWWGEGMFTGEDRPRKVIPVASVGWRETNDVWTDRMEGG